MEYRTLGRIGTRVLLLSMGTGGYKCLGQRAEPPYSESEILALLHGAFDLGMTFFDTAPGYLDSEIFLGKFFKEIRRDQFAVSTKMGLIDDREERPSPVVSSAEIIDAIEISLRQHQCRQDPAECSVVGEGAAGGRTPAKYRDAVRTQRRSRRQLNKIDPFGDQQPNDYLTKNKMAL